MQGPNEEKDPLDALRAELGRLRQKRQETTDPDIASVLDLRIGQIEAELPKSDEAPQEAPSEKEEEVVEEAPPPPPTPEEALEAENYVRQARVEKMRNNRQAATDFLKKAAAVAPGSPAVLEALGDDLAERKKMLEAKEIYAKAVALDKKNVGLERKYGQAVLAVEAAGSLEDQMRMNLSDSAFLTSADKVASLPIAIICSTVFPGLGHLILGQTAKGAWIMGAWVLFGTWLLSMFGDVAKLFAFGMGGGREQPNLVVLLPILIMAVIYVATLASFKTVGRETTRKPPERPKPPVDLPFE